eukprot:TRINITY_DN11771_c0_g1_i1.p1 TRINITY_DN11771_c0_g1~~TRINITY_DN11771_c0_g1_i1.p1  ORF type:complete len:182 (+),score=28.07 TRINITY_DN11771_c0_g1_i1:807-1352(+)
MQQRPFTPRSVRRIDYAMIAEFDAMVGAYMQAIEDAGLTDSTYWVITADHGDMQMEHQQFYKMVPYDASASVPLVISGPGIAPGSVTVPTEHVDLYLTIMDLAGVPSSMLPSELDGKSLVPRVLHGQPLSANSSAISQFHGGDLAMSWYFIRNKEWKLITYGTGREVPPHSCTTSLRIRGR